MITPEMKEFIAELKPCPCCGQSKHVVYDRATCRVTCGNCGMNTGIPVNPCMGLTVEVEAKITWNNRPGDIRYGIY